MHGGGWWGILNAPTEKPKVTWALMRRVLSYSRPYRWQIAGMLFLILCTTGLGLLTPLILRDLIDRTLPSKNLNRLIWLAVALLLIPAISGGIGVIQRRLNAYVGEGVIFDLRVALYARLQRMSLRFFTNTKVGELMSRLNNDVVGAQNAISNTIVSIITNIVQAAAVLGVMLTLEWRLTLVSVIILPLFIVVARKLGSQLRDISRSQMEANARMNAMMNETLNIGGALLVKLFGRTTVEVDRFRGRAVEVRDLGIRRALLGAVAETIAFIVRASEQFDQQRTADVERLVHVRVHLRVEFHGAACDVAQCDAQPLRSQNEQRQNQNTDNRQPPFESQHDGQQSNGFDDVGDDVDNRVADGILRADHIVVESAHQLADFGVGKESQRHSLQAREQRHTQIKDHAFADCRVQLSLNDRNPAVENREE